MRESNAEHQASVTVHRSAIEPDRAGPSPAENVGGSSNLRHALLLRLRHDGPSSPEDLAAAWKHVRKGLTAKSQNDREHMYLLAVAALYKDGGAGTTKRARSV